jgi:hypothetical protein
MFDKEKQYDEHEFLSKASSSVIYIGIYFLSQGMINVIGSEINAVLFILGMVGQLLGLRGIYLSFVAAKYGPSPLSGNYWFATFEDEYLNHLTMKGYKWAFMSISALLFILMIFGEGGFIGTQQSAPAAAVAMLLTGTLALAYGVPITYELRTDK